ncbi:MAG TPA: hypothetical protein PK988_07625, partial [Candidatus Sumerlaeota bacterium]|nr:hypothetical protein [Candidatus Sumerlaeota bacterium]
SEVDIRARLGLQQRQFDQLMKPLRDSGLVTGLANDSYQIAHPPEQIAVRDILALGCDISALPVSKKARAAALGSFDWLQNQSLQQVGETTLAELLESTPGKAA